MGSEDVPCTCACCAGPKLIFPCSGASDIGEITDRAGRRLMRSGVGKMYCLAGIGGHIPDMITQAQLASAILAIDGCEADCAKKTLEQAGFVAFQHLRVTDLGMEKGKSPATFNHISAVVEAAKSLLDR